MHARPRSVTIFAFLGAALVGTSAWAFSCKLDCEADYKAAVRACKLNYNQRDELHLQEQSQKSMADCLENAKNVYQDCLQDCQD
jgi:hypothetical protein